MDLHLCGFLIRERILEILCCTAQVLVRHVNTEKCCSLFVDCQGQQAVEK